MKSPFKSNNKPENSKKDNELQVDKTKRKDDKFDSFEFEPEDWDQPAVKNNGKVSNNWFFPQKSTVEVGKKTETKNVTPVYQTSYIPPIIDKKLSIILIENTVDVAKENDKLIKIIKKLVPTGLISIIHYGEDIRKTEICESYKFKEENFQCRKEVGETACLYDALVILHKLVTEEYMVVKKVNYRETRINEIEIIGIGTCKDNGSKNPKSVGINCFSDITKKPRISTKYFCLTENSFLDAAEIGFHSIGAVNLNYKQ